MMVDLVWRNQITQAQPEAVDKTHFVGRKVRSMRAEQEKFPLSSRRGYLQIELWTGILELLPGKTDLPCLLGQIQLRGPAKHNCAGLELHRGVQDATPHVVGRDDGQMNGLASLFGQRQSLREQELLDTSKQLLRFELARSGRRPAEKTNMEHDDIATLGFDAVQHGLQ